MRNRSLACLTLTILAAPAPLSAQTATPIELVCPVGGATFSYSAPPAPAPGTGERPDGKPLGAAAIPPELPVCPGNGFVMFQKEFSADDKAALEGLVADPRYKALAGDTSYYRAAWLMRELDRDPQEVAAMMLEASWQADADPLRKRHYQAEYAALVEPLVVGKGDDLSMLLAGRAANARRELGQFDAAAALLDTLPLASLAVVIPPEQLDGDRVTNSAEVSSARARRDLFAYLTGLKDLVAARNAGSEPLPLMPASIVAERCADADILSDDDRAYCAGDGLRKADAKTQ